MPTRRQFLERTAGGIGMMAVGAPSYRRKNARHRPHFQGTAKSVIFLNMPGGPSQTRPARPKAGTGQMAWQAPYRSSVTKDLKLAFIKPTANVVASPASSRLRAEWNGNLRLAAECGGLRGRSVPVASDAHRSLQP